MCGNKIEYGTIFITLSIWKDRLEQCRPRSDAGEYGLVCLSPSSLDKRTGSTLDVEGFNPLQTEWTPPSYMLEDSNFDFRYVRLWSGCVIWLFLEKKWSALFASYPFIGVSRLQGVNDKHSKKFRCLKT